MTVLLPASNVSELLRVKLPAEFPGEKIPPAWTVTGPKIIPVPPRVPLVTVTALVSVSFPFTNSVPPLNPNSEVGIATGRWLLGAHAGRVRHHSRFGVRVKTPTRTMIDLMFEACRKTAC